MSDLAIRVDNIAKRYRIGQRGNNYETLRECLVEGVRALVRRKGERPAPGSPSRPVGGSPGEHIWALSDVSFEIKAGEVVGIVGRNGAGKSTLLKILSRITDPTRGRAEVSGRLGSLLEVGTGFHPELTGRENAYLSGAILGMKKAEIERKFDDIVAFAEIEKFIDTPVKRYSSGMYVRLAFAVAAHLEPDILLVDEVLSVGDAVFQKKCLDRIRKLTDSGGTTLVVSHNMASIKSLCARTLWFDSGALVYDGETSEAVKRYVDGMNKLAKATVGPYLDSPTRRGTGEVRFTTVDVVDADGQPISECRMGEDLRIRAAYRAFRDVPAPEVTFGVRDVETGVVVTSVRARGLIPDLSAGEEGLAECVLEAIPFRARRYSLYLGLMSADYRRASYDAWDGAGADIVVSADGGPAEGGFILGHDSDLVSVAHRLSNTLIGGEGRKA